MKPEKNFLQVLQSVDAFFPIGAFTLSNGLEDYVVRERIQSAKELSEYLKGFMEIFPYSDLGLVSLAYRHAEEVEYLCRLDWMAGAMKSASEVRVGSSRMCSRYIKARTAMDDCSGQLKWYAEQVHQKKVMGFHPIALGIYARQLELDQAMLLQMYGYSVISAIVNNAVKLVPLSQLEGQRILFEYLEMLDETAAYAMQLEAEDLGVSGAAYEIHCMNHERLYSRQYMS